MYPRGYNSSTYNSHFLPSMRVENNDHFSPRQSVRPFGALQPDVISLSNWIDGPIGFGNEFTGFMPYLYLLTCT